MKQSLTPKQQGLYAEIYRYLTKYDQSPTLEELRKFLDVGSINSVVQHLIALEKKGYIIRRKNSKRNIELLEIKEGNKQTLSIPVMASVGCDDLSIFANEQHDEFIEIDKKILGDKKEVVAVRAIGDSMNDSGINDGDYILVELTNYAENGERVVVVVDEMVTVKRLERKNGLTILRPESLSSGYKPIIMNKDFKISGKVIATIPADSRDMTEVVAC